MSAEFVPTRMRRRAEFLRVQARGRRQRGRLMALLVAPQPEQGPARVGLTVSRKVGIAVVRNRVRRRLREIVRELGHEFAANADHVVIAYPKAADASFAELKQELTWLVKKAAAQASSKRH